MGLWILEDKVMDHVPGMHIQPYHSLIPRVDEAIGTTRYFDKPQEAGRESDSHLKRDTSGSVPIILVPQPSDDPNDPLVRPGQSGGWLFGC